jgi:hypothetical protein
MDQLFLFNREKSQKLILKKMIHNSIFSCICQEKKRKDEMNVKEMKGKKSKKRNYHQTEYGMREK